MSNGGPVPITLLFSGKSLGERVYAIRQGDRKLGIAFAKYTAPKPGYAGGTTFTSQMKNDSFVGSRDRLLAWVAQKTASDI
jgi:hypothetical protein